MSTDSHIDTFDQSTAHCSHCCTGGSGSYISPGLCGLTAPSAGFINVNQPHSYIDSFVSSPSNITFPNLALARTVDVTTPQDEHIPIWSSNLSTNDDGHQQQAVSITHNGWNPDVSLVTFPWGLASQGFDQSLSSLTTGFGEHFTPVLSSLNFPPTIIDDQPDPTFQTPDFGVYSNDVVMPNGFVNFNSSPWDDLTAMDTQPTTTSFNQFSFPALSSMPAASTLPINATSFSAAPAGRRPISRRVVSLHSNTNSNSHTCDYPGCGNVFGRMGDFIRHRKQHGVPQHNCNVHGCNRRGAKAFYRADKLRDHQRRKHRMNI